jgi:hypothetical protein
VLRSAVIIELILAGLLPPSLIALLLGLERVEQGLSRCGPRDTGIGLPVSTTATAERALSDDRGVRHATGGAGNRDRSADQIAKAKQLPDSGIITREEHDLLKREELGAPSDTTMAPS